MQPSEIQVLYRDRWIECTSEALIIHGYYFPFGNKRTIAYSDIRGVYGIEMGLFTGKWRIWGSGDFKYYFSLDPEASPQETGADRGHRRTRHAGDHPGRHRPG